MAVTIHLRSGTPIAFPTAAAVSFGALPARPDETPAKSVSVVTADGRVLGVFRLKEVGGYSIEPAS